MITVDHNNNIYRWTKEHGSQRITIGDVTERELLLAIAAKLHSIRGMVMFFTVLAFIGLISSIIAILSALSK